MDEEKTHEERGRPPKAKHGYTTYKTLRPAQSSGSVLHGEARQRPQWPHLPTPRASDGFWSKRKNAGSLSTVADGRERHSPGRH